MEAISEQSARETRIRVVALETITRAFWNGSSFRMDSKVDIRSSIQQRDFCQRYC
jgi:hypothetical protein